MAHGLHFVPGTRRLKLRFAEEWRLSGAPGAADLHLTLSGFTLKVDTFRVYLESVKSRV